MIIAPNILMVLVATAVRSAGSAGLYVYSTLLLQLQVPNELLGRILALEMALATVTAANSLASLAVAIATAWLQLGLHSTQLQLLGRILALGDGAGQPECHHRCFGWLSKASLCWAQLRCHQGCCVELEVHVHSSMAPAAKSGA